MYLGLTVWLFGVFMAEDLPEARVVVVWGRVGSGQGAVGADLYWLGYTYAGLLSRYGCS